MADYKKQKLELAKELFVKRCNTGFLTNANEKYIESSIKDAIEISELFFKLYEEQVDKVEE